MTSAEAIKPRRSVEFCRTQSGRGTTRKFSTISDKRADFLRPWDCSGARGEHLLALLPPASLRTEPARSQTAKPPGQVTRGLKELLCALGGAFSSARQHSRRSTRQATDQHDGQADCDNGQRPAVRHPGTPSLAGQKHDHLFYVSGLERQRSSPAAVSAAHHERGSSPHPIAPAHTSLGSGNHSHRPGAPSKAHQSRISAYVTTGLEVSPAGWPHR